MNIIRLLQLLSVIIVVGLIALLLSHIPLNDLVEILGGVAEKYRIRGALFLIATHIAGVSLFLPSLPWYLTFGFVYNFVLGLLFSCVGYTIGAFMNFLLGRILIRPRAGKAIEKSDRLKTLNFAFTSRGFLLAFLLRLVAVFPWNVLNVCLSITPLKSLTFIVSTFVGSIPSISSWVLIGNNSGALLNPNESNLPLIFIILGTIVFFIICAFFTRYVRQSLVSTAKEVEMEEISQQSVCPTPEDV
ncbi:hypothetical protein P9112_012082 [Eukaryota sp. TZLM1-RC]